MGKKYFTFTFDDGFIRGAKKIDKLLSPYKATFYITTGWVKPNDLPVLDAYNTGADHGTIDEWKELSANGHDIGSHSHSHKRPSELDADELQEDYQLALDFIKKIHDRPYSLSFPYNFIPEVADGYDSIRLGEGDKIFNDLAAVNLKKVTSWSPWLHPNTEEKEQKLFRQISEVPDDSWIVINLHSVDGEGWQPWSSARLERLKDFIVKAGFEIKTMAEMTELLRK